MAQQIAVAMSGGVDSSAAAWLLKEQGHDLMGITLTLFDDATANVPGNQQDVQDAKAVAEQLGFPHHVFHMAQCFREQVMDRFAAAYEAGATPNPCVVCNRHIKFGALLEQARKLDAQAVATGHYAQVGWDEGSRRYLLRKAAHPEKDQSYVLYALTQDQLSASRFPLGHLTKNEIREIALSQGLVSARKRESQDICFVPDGDYAKFIEQYTGKSYPNGDFVDESGKVLGEHKGIIRYTVGQRKGLGLALPCPMYVKEKDLENNKVILCTNDALFSKELYATDINLISVDKITEPMRVNARVRYNQKEQPATVTQIDDNTIHVVFDEPQRAISKGQAVVLYDGDYVVGGGTII